MIVMTMMITVMLIEAVYEIISATDSWHFYFWYMVTMVMMMITVVMIEAVYEITSVTDAWHLWFQEDGHDGDDDDNSDDDRGCIWN